MSRRQTDLWITAVRRWEAGLVGPEGEQLSFPGMPEPPKYVTTRVLPFVLVTYANADGTNVRPSRDSIARILGCSPRTVQRRIGELELLGLIVRTNRAHRGHAQEWILVLPAWLSGSHKKGDTGDSLSEPNGRHTAPQRETRVTPHQSSPSEKTSTSSARFQSARAADNKPAPEPTVTVPPAAASPSPITEERGNEEPSPVDHKTGRDAARRGRDAAVRALIDNRYRDQDVTDTATRARYVADLQRAGLSDVTDEARAEALDALKKTNPETVAPTEHTENHAAH